jgi:hypothetical protein
VWLAAVFTLSACLSCTTLAAAATDPPPDLNAQTQTTTSPTPAQSDSAGDDNNWHMTATPYLWFPGISGTSGAFGHNLSIHASPGDLLSNFQIGLAGAGEIRKGRLLIPIDFMWMKLQGDKSTDFDPGVSYAVVHLTQTMLTPGIGYRIVDHEKLKVDARIGARYWHLGQNVTFYPSGALSGFSPSANWVDAIAGANIQMALSPKVLVTIVGDAGGGGANLDYQAVGFLGFKVSQKVILQMGWRYLDVNYRTNPPVRFVYDAHMSGAIIGATFNLK